MPSLSDDQLLRLYEIETRQVHSSLNHILRIRGMMAVAFAALLSATLIYRQGVIALGSLIFLAAWYYEYIYARYLGVYIARVGQLQLWLANVTQNVGDLSQKYARGYDHRQIARLIQREKVSRLVNRFVQRVNTERTASEREVIREDLDAFLGTFFDLPRVLVYLAMSFAPLAVANLLKLPWTS